MSAIQQLNDLIDKASAASDKLHQIVHGSENEEVITESGPVPTLANWYKRIEQIRPGLLALRDQLQASDGATLVGYGDETVGSVLQRHSSVLTEIDVILTDMAAAISELESKISGNGSRAKIYAAIMALR